MQRGQDHWRLMDLHSIRLPRTFGIPFSKEKSGCQAKGLLHPLPNFLDGADTNSLSFLGKEWFNLVPPFLV